MIDWLLAADFYLTLGGWSIHSEKTWEKCTSYGYSEKYNGSHNAIILDVDGFTIGTYENSYGYRTNLAGYTHRIDKLSLTAAYGTGYKEHTNTCTLDLGKECLLITAAYSSSPIKVSLVGDAVVLSLEFKLQ